ncbi:MAG: chloride channel protein [Candidimonas sp.]|nr:MAG: chloride channel protein [Candidimonas sp.]TAM19565.1 MAG: chloride channel protein [Candidimonas sp.]
MLATIAKWLFLAIITGLIVGTGTSAFLHALFYSTEKTAHVSLWFQMMLLPLGGILNGLILHYGYRKSSDGIKDSVIAAVHTRSGIMPYKTFLIKPITAIITLALGGSAGKEGPCSHIGGTLASWFGRLIRLDPEMQKRIVACGVSAGFASVFGTPIAGAIYGVEMLAIGRIRHDFIFPGIIAAITSFEISRFWGITYDYFPLNMAVPFSTALFTKVILIGILCGLVSWLFIEFIEQIRLFFTFIQKQLHIWMPLMPFLGGLILAALILIIPTDYLGLSLPLMNNALHGQDVPFFGFLWKSLLVAITLGSGFYGGIVTPQFVMGALAGNAFAHLLGISPALGAAIGMVAVVAAASNTPIAAVFMGLELFGSSSGMYVACACVTAYIVVGHRSVYSGQLLAYSKSLWMVYIPETALNREKIHISYGLLRKLQFFRRRKSKGLRIQSKFRNRKKE